MKVCKRCGESFPLEEFKAGSRTYKNCFECRETLRAINHSTRKNHGYEGGPPKQYFELAPHHRLANCFPGFARGPYIGGEGLLLFTSPDGRPVIRLHGDLKPGEVSWVLG